MFRVNAAVAVLAIVLLAGCTKPLDTVIPTDQSEWDAKLVPAVKKLSPSDRALFANYVARHVITAAFSGTKAAPIPIGTTVGEAIQEQREFEVQRAQREAEARAQREQEEAAQRARQAAEAQRQQEAAAHAATVQKQIDAAVTATLVKKGFNPRDYSRSRISDYLTYEVAVKNVGDKTIRGVSGLIVFVDLFNTTVGRKRFKVLEKIEPGKTYVWRGVSEYNQFNDQDRAIHDLNDGDYHALTPLSSVVFENGSTLTLPTDRE